MANTIKVKQDGKTLTVPYSVETVKTSLIKFGNGKELNITGSVANAVIQKAYDAKWPSVSTPIPPVDTKPEPPVVIPPTVPQQPNTKVRSISIRELSDSKGLKNENVKVVKGVYNDQYWLTDLQGVKVDLSECQFGTKYMPVLELKGDCSGLTIEGGLFKNANKCINYYNEVTVRNLVLKGITVIDSGQLFGSGGYMNEQGMFGKTVGFKMLNCVIRDSASIGTVLWLNAAEDFEISGNVIDNINTDVNNHNGIFMLGGNGVIKNNKCTNHQGDLVRATPYQVDGSGKQLVIERNIVFRSRKYGAFEVKANDVSGFKSFRPSNVIVRNNTAGQLNLSKDWDAKLIDVYDINSKSQDAEVRLENNLGFELVQQSGGAITKLTNNMNSDKTRVVETGSKYFTKWQEAVTDLETFKSKHPGVGAL